MNGLNKARWVTMLAMCAVVGGLLSGCAWSIGSSREGPPVKATTKGQELVDLKKARDSGAISQDEYETQKQKVLDR